MLYTPLSQLENGQDQVNIYALVIDASLPNPAKDQNKFICTVKIIDHTYHSTGNEPSPSYKHMSCIFYAKKAQDCPQPKHIGDIIRVHRASVKEYQGKFQLHVNVHFNSSWVLFPAGVDIDQAYRFSGKNHSFDNNIEVKILQALRQFGQQYFNEHSVVHQSNFTPLMDCFKQERKELDLMVKLLRVFDRDDLNLEVAMRDQSCPEQTIWSMSVGKAKLSEPLIEGEVYRVRGVWVDRTSERNMMMAKPQTNFLRFPYYSQVYQKLALLTDCLPPVTADVLMQPRLATTTCGLHERMFRLQDLFCNYEQLAEIDR